MPSYAITASLYIDGCKDDNEAAQVARSLPDEVFCLRTGKTHTFEVIVSEDSSWEVSGDDDDDDAAVDEKSTPIPP